MKSALGGHSAHRDSYRNISVSSQHIHCIGNWLQFQATAHFYEKFS